MHQDTASFQSIYERYSQDVYRFSYWMCGNAENAKDIAAETFVRAWTSEKEIRVESVKAYLFAIARNLYLHQKRRSRRMSPLTEDMQDTSMQPGQRAEDRSELEVTLTALQTLPEIDRAVLIMRAEDSLSYQDIARITGLSLSAVKVKVFRARATLLSLTSRRKGTHV